MSESGFSGFTGCDGKIVFGKWGFFLSDSEAWRKPYQDFQDFQDLQDVMERLFLGSGDFFCLIAKRGASHIRIFRI